MKNNFNKRGTLAISQILLLIIGIIAISYALGSEIGEVRGEVEKLKVTAPSSITPAPPEGSIYYMRDGSMAIDAYNSDKVWTYSLKKWTNIINPVTAIHIKSNAKTTAQYTLAGEAAATNAVPNIAGVPTLAPSVSVGNIAELAAKEAISEKNKIGGEVAKAKLEYDKALNAGNILEQVYIQKFEELKPSLSPGEISLHETQIEGYNKATKALNAGNIAEAKRASAESGKIAATIPKGSGLETTAQKVQTSLDATITAAEKKISWEQAVAQTAERLITDKGGFYLLDKSIPGLKIDEESFGNIIGIKDPVGGKFPVETDLGKTAELTAEQLKDKGILDAFGNIDKSKIQISAVETESGIGNFLANQWRWDVGASNFFGHVVDGFMWAGAVIGAVQLIKAIAPPEYDSFLDAAQWSLGAGVLAGQTVYGLVKSGGWIGGAQGLLGIPLPIAIVAGTGIALWVFFSLYKQENQKVVSFSCNPWDAPTGGSYCEECNKQSLPCSEYQCRSLGQSCQLINPGTEEEKCAWVNRKDVEYPTIEPWKDALQNDFEYQPDDTISPPDRGVKVWNKESTTGCAKAFSPISFGVTTNEPSKCKLDITKKKSFDDMAYYFSNGLFRYNHSFIISLPSSAGAEAEGITIKNDGNYELFVRCQDANGNANVANFVFKYCVEKGPDTTPPLIVTTNLLNNMPIAFNQNSTDIELYVNEPATCKWSHLDKDYEQMEKDMTCASSITEINAQMLYKCTGILTGLKDRIGNEFYFRCKDQPSKPEKERNVNRESYKFTLIGTQPLVINSVGPNGTTIKDSTNIIKTTLTATTSAGYNEGQSSCYFSTTGEEGNYVLFANTNSYQHSQELWLPAGNYNYFIKCVDLGGNSDNKKINFAIESDTFSPQVVRAYQEETQLKIITSEPGECVYDIVNCNYVFEDGIKMIALSDVNHFTDWKTDINFFVKCRDSYGNQPAPNECSIIVRGFEF